ncbi:MAG TPA: type VI secretion system baseplate subunit TssG [Longimicrobium sp.]|nr:type VI secretion system baseplate subunit TssG [Longimicrobium sp.]
MTAQTAAVPAPPAQRAANGVEEALYAHGGAFDFYQAVRLLEWTAGAGRGVGQGADPAREAVRFRAAVDLAFPASEVVAVERPADGLGPATMTVAFLGLAGAHGPLPMPLTERVLERLAEGDTAGRDFLDLFHHRLVSLAFRIGRRMHPVLQDVFPEETETAEALWALVGLGTPETRGRMDGVDDRAFLARAGLLAGQPRSEAGLRGLLADHYGVPVTIEPLVGGWLRMPDDEWTRIGRTGAHRTLGTDAVLGRRVWDPQAAVRIRMGPLPLELYQSLLPGGRADKPKEGAGLTQLREMVRFYAGVETDFVLTLVLRAEEAPPTLLPPAGSPDAPRLGWTSWLRTVPLTADPQVEIDPERACGCGCG